eukprot:3707907-Pyramimonas_sp.AAC.1
MEDKEPSSPAAVPGGTPEHGSYVTRAGGAGSRSGPPPSKAPLRSSSPPCAPCLVSWGPLACSRRD